MKLVAMPDPALAIRTRLEAAIEAALGPEFAGVDPVIRPSDHADFQANAAMALAKRAGRNPRELAGEITVADISLPRPLL